MKRFLGIMIFLACTGAIFAQSVSYDGVNSIRPLLDSTGYANTTDKIDSIMKRIERYQGQLLTQAFKNAKVDSKTQWKVAISPHDDYTYAGYLYPAVFTNMKARTVFLFGVCHPAKKFGLQDKLIFEDFDYWKGIYRPVTVSYIRNVIKDKLDKSYYVTHDSVQMAEHSLEALIPFLQYYDENVQIVPVLVPYMSYGRMDTISKALAKEINDIASKKNWVWGRDYSIVISNDCVHYGDEDWGGNNYAFFGADSAGYKKALEHEHEIIDNCLVGEITPEKVKKFTQYTVKESDYKEYKYTWCGRYSVPFGLLLARRLGDLQNIKLEGVYLGHSTSIANPPIPAKDLGMGSTAPANLHHWVGYVGMGFK